ncbi:unnamed protein product [Candidula unifasciata]|uniref:Tetraspanin n=1 Tax=Candidula unifasciata TaxID=100452 RepID=A0A8S3ZL29_9EUPU|nr:unnamed protein product [Candidula unifasciata]
MSCTESARVCLKFTVIFMNIPVAMAGIISLCVGIWVLASDDSFFDLTADVLDLEVLDQDVLQRAAIIMVSAGAAILVLATLGVIGALSMNSCVLVFYVIPLIVLLTLEAAVIVLTVVFKSEWEPRVDQFVKGQLVAHYGDSVHGDSFTRSFDVLQRKLGCCGWESSQDYQKLDNGHWNTSMDSGQRRQVPDSCCVSENVTWTQECVVSPYNSTGFSSKGCREAVTTEFQHYQWTVLGVTVSVIVFQFILVILTLALVVHNVNHKYNLS